MRAVGGSLAMSLGVEKQEKGQGKIPATVVCVRKRAGVKWSNNNANTKRERERDREGNRPDVKPFQKIFDDALAVL